MNQDFILKTDLSTLKSMLAVAEKSLRDILSQIEHNIPPETIKGTPELNNLLNFSSVLEAKILASKTVGSSEGSRGAAKEAILDMLDNLIILKDYLDDKTSIASNDLVLANQIKTARKDSIKRFNEIVRVIVSSVVVEGKQPALLETKNYSSDKLLRQVTRAVATADDFENDLTLLFSSLIYEAHKDSRVLPVILKALNKEVIESQSFEFAKDQNYRDEAGNSLTGLIKKIAQKKDFTLSDEDFAKAYNATVRYLIKIYSTVLATNPDFRRTPEQVEQIKKELLSDIKLPSAPAPVPMQKTAPIPVHNQSKPSGTPLEFPTGSIASVPTPPKPPSPPVRNASPSEAGKPTQSHARPGEVIVRKIEKKVPDKNNLKPIQPIDLL